MTDTINVTLVEGTIAKLDLGPDDIVVLKITDPNWRPVPAGVEDMKKRVRAVLGEDREVIILAHGLDLEIVQRPIDDAAFGETEVPA